VDASHVYWDAAYQSVVRRVATCLKWEVGSLTSAKAKGPLNSKGLALWLAYIYMQLAIIPQNLETMPGIFKRPS
jgi:hypothetical protein